MKRAGIWGQLDELGFEKGCISEAILSTTNSDGTPNASPMGVLRVGSETLEARPFKTSTTYGNLLRDSRACVNVTSDPSLFLVSAFKRERFEGFPGASFEGELRLASSDAHVFVEALGHRDISDLRCAFMFNPISVEVCRPLPRVFSRGSAEAIEAIIHATRIEAFTREGGVDDVERLIKRFRACKDVVGRVSAPDSKEARVIQELERLIRRWGDKK